MTVKTESRQVQGFDQVSLEGFGEIILTQGEAESLTIEAEKSLLPYLKSDVKGGRLRLGMRSWLDMLFVFPKGPVRYTITMKNITGLKKSGSGKVTANSTRTNYLDLGISGSGTVPYIGKPYVSPYISGAGRVEELHD